MTIICCSQALEQGLGGVVLKAEDVEEVLKLKVFNVYIFVQMGAVDISHFTCYLFSINF